MSSLRGALFRCATRPKVRFEGDGMRADQERSRPSVASGRNVDGGEDSRVIHARKTLRCRRAQLIAICAKHSIAW